MIVPTRLALTLVSLGLLVCALAAIDRSALWVALGLNLLVFAGVLAQGRMLRRHPIRATRQWLAPPQAGKPNTLRITLENQGKATLRLAATQAWPSRLTPETLGPHADWACKLAPQHAASFDAVVTPHERGPLMLPPLTVDAAGPMSLAAHRTTHHHGRDATVLPSLAGIRHYEKLRRSRALRAAGFHRQRVVGLGREFDQMREYLPGDDFRDVNWKATARSGQPRTNLYQVERSRDLILCLDGGRLMGQPVGNRTALDHAVDAALMLTHAGHDQGDRVGLVTFRDRVDTVLRPGTTNAPAILRQLAAFDSQPVFPSYLALVETLRLKQTHRGLVFLFTDLADPQLTADLVEALPLLVAHHLVVVVSLRDTLFERVATGAIPAGPRGVTRVLAARHLTLERRQRAAQLRKAGVSVLEADTQRLSLSVMNHYLAVKSRQLL